MCEYEENFIQNQIEEGKRENYFNNARNLMNNEELDEAQIVEEEKNDGRQRGRGRGRNRVNNIRNQYYLPAIGMNRNFDPENSLYDRSSD